MGLGFGLGLGLGRQGGGVADSGITQEIAVTGGTGSDTTPATLTYVSTVDSTIRSDGDVYITSTTSGVSFTTQSVNVVAGEVTRIRVRTLNANSSSVGKVYIDKINMVSQLGYYDPTSREISLFCHTSKVKMESTLSGDFWSLVTTVGYAAGTNANNMVLIGSLSRYPNAKRVFVSYCSLETANLSLATPDTFIALGGASNGTLTTPNNRAYYYGTNVIHDVGVDSDIQKDIWIESSPNITGVLSFTEVPSLRINNHSNKISIGTASFTTTLYSIELGGSGANVTNLSDADITKLVVASNGKWAATGTKVLTITKNLADTNIPGRWFSEAGTPTDLASALKAIKGVTNLTITITGINQATGDGLPSGWTDWWNA
jgi:hypothetical protein